jgi:hypothetical protein
LETGGVRCSARPAGAVGAPSRRQTHEVDVDNSPIAKSAALIASLFSPCYLLLEKLSKSLKSLIVIARFSAIVSLFLLEYVPVSVRGSIVAAGLRPACSLQRQHIAVVLARCRTTQNARCRQIAPTRLSIRAVGAVDPVAPQRPHRLSLRSPELQRRPRTGISLKRNPAPPATAPSWRAYKGSRLEIRLFMRPPT